uniref:Uncharacterized protein n=1 Tax=Arundo donax TaxID=35708 RepID=A0A0A9HPH5_ARUDO
MVILYVSYTYHRIFITCCLFKLVLLHSFPLPAPHFIW